MKILITGHRGLIGSSLYKKLEYENQLIGLDRNDGFDLNNEKETEKVIKLFRPDVIYMLAAEASESTSQTHPVNMTHNNVGIFTNVLKAATNVGIKKIIYTSSVAVYGEANVPYREDGPTIPKDIYGINKLACEQMLKVMAKVYHFDYTIFRPHNVYGPGQKMSDPSRNVVALFMRAIIEKTPYKLYGNGEMRRAFSYVEDVTDVLAEAINVKYNGFTINVGSTKDVTIKELSDMVQSIAKRKAKIEMLPARPQEVMMFLADHFLQNKIFQYKETPLKEGLQKTWDWVNSKPLPPKKVREVEICLPQ